MSAITNPAVLPVLTVLAVLLALLLDRLLGEPRRYHPLVGFGNMANRLEAALNRGGLLRLKGLLAVTAAILPALWLSVLLQDYLQGFALLGSLVAAVLLYIAIGWQSLLQHARRISQPLQRGDIASARAALSQIVSRDTAGLHEQDIAKAATESVLENGADAIFSAIFWFCLLGMPGVVLYRLSNTLDAMWGYKNSRFLHFGWAAARLDDLLNFIPARLTALSYALVGATKVSLRCWRGQGFSWKSPNAGPVMAAGAGALQVSLGGAAQYHGQRQFRPTLGLDAEQTELLSATTIERACALVNRALLLWLAVLLVWAGIVALLVGGMNGG